MMLRVYLTFALTISLVPTPGQTRQSRPCDALQSRTEQSSAALEGRLLHEALFEAAALDCPGLTLDLLDKGASVNARNRFGAISLNTAAGRGAREVATMLLNAGAGIEHRDLNGATPLLYAARGGRRKMATDLINAGADVNSADKQGITPLMAAAFEGDIRLVRLFLEAGAKTDEADIHGKGALVYAAGRAYPAIVAELIEAGAKADLIWGNDLTALMWAAGHANEAPAKDGIDTARILLEAGAPLNARDNRGRTALMVAAVRGHQKLIEYLLQKGADPSARDLEDKTAADLSESDTIRVLLDQNALR